MEQPSQDGPSGDGIAQAKAEVNAPAVAPVKAPLPEHSAEATDLPTGHTYYYHIPTAHSQ